MLQDCNCYIGKFLSLQKLRHIRLSQALILVQNTKWCLQLTPISSSFRVISVRDLCNFHLPCDKDTPKTDPRIDNLVFSSLKADNSHLLQRIDLANDELFHGSSHNHIDRVSRGELVNYPMPAKKRRCSSSTRVMLEVCY